MSITQLTFEAISEELATDSGLTTASGSEVTTTGNMTAGSTDLTVASATSYSAGHGICIAGAGTSGGRYVSWIESIAGTVLTLKSKAVTTVTGAAVSHDDRFVVAANQIQPSSGNLPAVFPCIQVRMDGGEGSDFNNSMSGDVYFHIYYQSEPGSSGQPNLVLNMICDRIKDLLHDQENTISNSAVRIQLLREAFKSGVIPESDISETTHSQTLRYELMSNIA